MNDVFARMNAYFDEQTALCAQQEYTLRADGRDDEASFEKIRANVFDIFRTMLSVARRVSGEEDAAANRFFLEKLDTIPENWRTALAQAEAHGDAVRAQIERVKLGALDEIRRTFSDMEEM